MPTRAGLRDGPERDDGFGAFEEHRDAIAGDDAASLERECERARVRVELAVRDRAAAMTERDRAFRAHGRSFERRGQENRDHRRST